MNKQNVISARVDAETLALIDTAAKAQGRSRAWFVANAVKQVAEKESAFLAYVQQGVDDFEAGRFITHDELVERIRQRRQPAQAA